MIPADMRSEIRWLASGFLLTFSSGFGQTYFIALFAGHMKSTLDLSDSVFGILYMAATLTSAALLMWAGKFADTLAIRWLGAAVLCGLAAVSLAMASVSSGWMLAIILFGLRFFGQGMLTHTAMTAIGRWFNAKRGRAISIAALGFPVSEALLPAFGVAVLTLVGWREAWIVFAIAILLIPLPILIVLLARDRIPSAAACVSQTSLEITSPEAVIEVSQESAWTRGDVLRSPLFWGVLTGVVVSPFVCTGIFINQVPIATAKGWDISWFALGFTLLACASVIAALIAGWIVDKAGAFRLLPVYLVPLVAACVLLAYATSPYALLVFMALIGLTMGGMATVQGVLWAELYGTVHLGAIRAAATAFFVCATALSPALTGVLLDAGITVKALLLGGAVICVLASLWMGVLQPQLRRQVAAAS